MLLVVLSLFLWQIAQPSNNSDSFVFYSPYFEKLEAEKLTAIQQAVNHFNKTHINRKVYVLINYDQTEKSQQEKLEEVSELQKKVMESVDRSVADTIDILFFYYSNLFDLNPETENLAILKNYYFLPQSTHLSTVPDAAPILRKNSSEMPLEEFLKRFLDAYGGEISYNNQIPDFAPVAVSMSPDKLEFEGVDKEGLCNFRYERATIDLSLPLMNLEISGFKGVDVLYSKNCSTSGLTDGRLSWEGEKRTHQQGLEVILHKLDLRYRQGRMDSGGISLDIKATEEFSLGGGFVLQPGMLASIEVRYSEGEPKVNWKDISGLKCQWHPSGGESFDLTIGSPTLAGKANFYLKKENSSINTELLTAEKLDFSLQGRLDIENLSVTLEKAYLQGEITLETPVSLLQMEVNMSYSPGEDILQGPIANTKGQLYGLDLKSEQLDLQLGTDLELLSLSGAMEVKGHKGLRNINSDLRIDTFRYEHNRLSQLVFSGHARVKSTGLTVEIEQAKLEEDHLEVDVQVVSGNDQYESGVDAKAKIYPDSISMDRIAVALHPPPFGPIQVEVEGTYYNRSTDPGWDRYEDVKLKFMLATSDHKIREVSGKGSFELHGTDRSRFRNVKLMVKDISEDLRPKITYLGSTALVSSVDIEIDEQGNLNGYIDFDLRKELTDDGSIHLLPDLLTIDSYQGRLRYNFVGESSLKGTFQLNRLTGVHASLLRKGKSSNQVLATLSNGEIDQSGSLTGTLSLAEGRAVNLKIRQLEMSLEQLNLEIRVENAIRVIKNPGDTSSIALELTSGGGKVFFKKIPKLDGSFSAELRAAGDSIAFDVATSRKLRSFGFEMDSVHFEGSFEADFTLRYFHGKMRARHEKIDGYLTVSSLTIRDGQLEDLKMRGRARLTGTEMIVNNASYDAFSNLITINAVLKFPTAPNQYEDDMSEIRLSDFMVTTDGQIQRIKLLADINADPFHINISGLYEDSTFEASFTTELFNNRFAGDMYLGSRALTATSRYNYFYLAGEVEVGKGGIPLGPTGIFLNKLGGSIGYNYFYDFKSYSDSNGGPRHNSYTASLAAGVKSTAFKTSGRIGLSFGPEKQQYYASADFAIPGDSPVLTAQGDIVYTIEGEEETVSGKLSSTLQLPRGSGDLLDLKADLRYESDQDGWRLGSSGTPTVSGEVLREIEINGNLVASGNIRKQKAFTGTISGELNYNWEFQYKDDFFAKAISVNAYFNNNVTLAGTGSINNNYLDLKGCGNVELLVSGDIKFGPKTLAGELDIEGELSFDSKSATILLLGNARASSQDLGLDSTKDIAIDYNLSKSELDLFSKKESICKSIEEI